MKVPERGSTYEAETGELCDLGISQPQRQRGLCPLAAASFAAQLDPTLDELGDIKTAVSEAVTNAIVHAYPNELGKIVMKLRGCWKIDAGVGNS